MLFIGADIVAPSCMMDGHVTAIKQSLMKENLLSRVSVLSYSAKFCSVFYGPFRDAANCAPSFSNRSSYQIPVGSSSIAERVVVSSIGYDWGRVLGGLVPELELFKNTCRCK